MTNADRIRQMDNDNLADFLLNMNCAYFEAYMIERIDCKTNKDCKDCFKEWLESEVEND